MRPLVEQLRARYALAFIQQEANFIQQDTKRGPEQGRKLYTHIHKTPIYILNFGLGQAMAVLLSDNEGAHGKDRQPSGRLYDCIEDWLCGPVTENRPMRVYTEGKPSLIHQIVEGSSARYRAAEAEAIRLFIWLKKFADAFLPRGGNGT